MRLLCASRPLPMAAILVARAITWSSNWFRRHRFEHEPDLGRFRPCDEVSGQEQPLRPLRPGVVDPHVGGWATLRPYRREANLGIVGGHDHVAVEGQVRAAGDAVAVDLGDYRDTAVPDVGPLVGDVAHQGDILFDCHRGPVTIRAPRCDVVAGAERGARAADDDAANLVGALGPQDLPDQLVAELEGQGISFLGPVQSDPLHPTDPLDPDGGVVLAVAHVRPPHSSRPPGSAGQTSWSGKRPVFSAHGADGN